MAQFEEHLDRLAAYAADLAGATGKTARIFWRLVERLPWQKRYELLQELRARNWVTPRYMTNFQEYYEYQPEYQIVREHLEYRRGWLADKYNDYGYWRKISGGN